MEWENGEAPPGQVTSRGGDQRIPRPADFRPGGVAPWAKLPVSGRRFSLGDVRCACAGMAPPRRPPVTATASGSRNAAVLVPLYEEAGEAVVVLIKRPETLPSHRGEIAFPGGSFAPSVDRSLRAAALREAQEEVGLSPSRVEVVAELDTAEVVVSGYLVTPFVGLLDARPSLVPDPREVASVLEVPLSELLTEGVYRQEFWDHGQRVRTIHFFELEGETVWGLTARILVSFLARLTARP